MVRFVACGMVLKWEQRRLFLDLRLPGQQCLHGKKSIGSDKMGQEAMISFQPYFMASSLRILLQKEHNAIET